jgi:hypothetical protein
MSTHELILISAAVTLLTACGATPEERKQHAEAEYTQEKTKILQDYKACVKKAKGDEKKLNNCEALLKAVDAVEGGK